jgi:hypothetical protein
MESTPFNQKKRKKKKKKTCMYVSFVIFFIFVGLHTYKSLTYVNTIMYIMFEKQNLLDVV